MSLYEVLPWPIRAVVARLVAPLVGAAVGVLLTLGLVSPQGGACLELLARELLADKPSASSLSRLPPGSPPATATPPASQGSSGSQTGR